MTARIHSSPHLCRSTCPCDRFLHVCSAYPLKARFAGIRFTMQYDGSERVAGLQVADIISNTLFHSTIAAPTAQDAAALIRSAQDAGHLVVRAVELEGRRPAWLMPAP
ncbi:MAG: hypothetical protein HQL41_07335 [Alphaproteobacteria bacterium]|nr:hypothetical protein [Alphaproteobacteria bacterium]